MRTVPICFARLLIVADAEFIQIGLVTAVWFRVNGKNGQTNRVKLSCSILLSFEAGAQGLACRG